MKNKSLKITLFSLLLILTISACDPYYNGGYNSPPPYYGNSGYNYDNDYYSRREAEKARNERYRLEKERDRLEDERRRYEDQRHNQPVYNPPVQRQPDCPSGFYKGAKCSNDERRRGCRDLRGPNGDSCRSM